MTAVATTDNHASPLEKLPSELLSKIFGFLELSSMWRVTSCSNKSLRKTLTQDCASLWTHIRFANTRGAEMPSLTDYVLEKILTRVNAKERCVALDLSGCNTIRGMGLVPLLHSRVLERVVFDKSTWDDFNVETVIWVLDTMIPYNLCDVVFPSREYDEDAPEDARDEFIGRLRTAQLEKARQSGLLCSSCTFPVYDKGEEDMPIVPIHCSFCSNNYCLSCDCRCNLKTCLSCEASSCNDCDKIKECGWCDDEFCRDCDNFSRCNECDQCFCASCIVGDNAMANCGPCGRIFCNECRVVYSDCLSCRTMICNECDTLDRRCDTCNNAMCNDCSHVCESCSVHWCEAHSTVQSLKCTCCSGKKLCVACVEMRACCFCLDAYCAKNQDMQVCDNPQCRDNVCRSCYADTFVSCESCNVKYCDECEELLCCPQCGKDSCRKCREGFGALCDDCAVERPPKKAKTA